MEKFNNTTLFTGYLKQLLHNFNLPKYRVYTKEHEEYFKKHKKESPEIIDSAIYISSETPEYKNVLYIKDGEIQEYLNGEWINAGQRDNVKIKKASHYTYNQKILNYTKNLLITNNSYDAYTHEYLGDFLRFQRDYNNIDLMSLYNCFNDRQCDKLEIKSTALAYNPVVENSNITYKWVEDKSFSFDTTDKNYKIYMMPIKLFKSYTIAIDSATPIEICCGIYSLRQDIIKKYLPIYRKTYQYFSSCNFNQPQLYSKILGLSNEEIADIITHEQDFKLFLKIPVYNTSSITILEGDYTAYTNPISINYNVPGWVATQTNVAVNNVDILNDQAISFDDIYSTATINNGRLEIITNNRAKQDTDIYHRANAEDSTLNFTSTALKADYKHFGQTPNFTSIANRTIINFEGNFKEIKKLITPLQLLKLNTGNSYPFADRLIEYLIGNAITSADSQPAKNVARVQKALENNTALVTNGVDKNGALMFAYRYKSLNTDIWDDDIKYIIYDYMNNKFNNKTIDQEINHDILGYIDKDVEKFYQYENPDTGEEINISNTSIEDK